MRRRRRQERTTPRAFRGSPCASPRAATNRRTETQAMPQHPAISGERLPLLEGRECGCRLSAAGFLRLEFCADTCALTLGTTPSGSSRSGCRDFSQAHPDTFCEYLVETGELADAEIACERHAPASRGDQVPCCRPAATIHCGVRPAFHVYVSVAVVRQLLRRLRQQSGELQCPRRQCFALRDRPCSLR